MLTFPFLLPFLALFTLATALSKKDTPHLSGNAVDMTSGQGGTYPRANILADGSLLGTYSGVSGDNKELRLVKSTDSGASWTQIGVAATRPFDSSDLDNPYPVQLPSRRVLLAYRNHDKDASSGDYTAFRIDVSYSDDKGKTWKYLSTPIKMPGGPIGVWEPLLRVAQDKTLQIYYSKELATDNQDQIQRISKDGGKTWGPEKTIAGKKILSRDGMTGVATVEGKKLIAVFESLQDSTFQIDAIDS